MSLWDDSVCRLWRKSFRCTDYQNSRCDKNVRKWSLKDDGFFLRFHPQDDEHRIMFLYVCRQTQLNITPSTINRTIVLSYAMASLHIHHDINRLRPRQNDRHFVHDIFKRFFLNENVSIPIKISLKFVLMGPINSILALVQIMAWCRPGAKPLPDPTMVRLPTHICVTHISNSPRIGPAEFEVWPQISVVYCTLIHTAKPMILQACSKKNMIALFISNQGFLIFEI